MEKIITKKILGELHHERVMGLVRELAMDAASQLGLVNMSLATSQPAETE